MKKQLGYFLLLIVVGGLVGLCIYEHGIIDTLIIWGSAIVITIIAIVGMKLITEE